MSSLLLVLVCVFQTEGSPCPQVGYDLEQMGKLHLWIELKHSFFLSAWSSQKSDSRVPSGLNRRMKEIVSWQRQESQNLGGFQKREINQSIKPLARISCTWEVFGEFSLGLLRSSPSASLEESIWSTDQAGFADRLVLIWLCLMEMRIILERTILCFSGC